MIHYGTLFHTISHCDTPESTETEHSRFCSSKPPLPLPRPPYLRVLVAPLPPHSTGCSMHLEGVMLSTSVERASGKTCNVSRWGGSGFEMQQSNSKKQWRWQRQRQRRRKWQRQRSGGGGCSAVAVEAAVAVQRRRWK